VGKLAIVGSPGWVVCRIFLIGDAHPRRQWTYDLSFLPSGVPIALGREKSRMVRVAWRLVVLARRWRGQVGGGAWLFMGDHRC